MEIEYPIGRKPRQYPPDGEIREVLEKIAAKCGFRPSQFRLDIIGGDRRKYMQRAGIKLKEPHPFSVLVYVGCRDESVEGHLHVTGDDKRSIQGQKLFDHMLNTFDRNRIHLVDLAGKPRAEKPAVAFNPIVIPPKEPTLQVVLPEPPRSVTHPVTPPVKPPLKEQKAAKAGSGYYFDKPDKFHLTVFALVAICDENVNYLFSTKTFEQALDSSHVPKAIAPTMLLLRTFLLREMIVRANPGLSPARYKITQKAIEFARGPVPTEPTRTVRTPRKPKVRDEEKPNVSDTTLPPRTNQALIIIGETFEKQVANLKADLGFAEARLAKLNREEIEQQIHKADAEIESLNIRLEAIRNSRAFLVERRHEIASVTEDVKRLRKLVNNPEVERALILLNHIREPKV